MAQESARLRDLVSKLCLRLITEEEKSSARASTGQYLMALWETADVKAMASLPVLTYNSCQQRILPV